MNNLEITRSFENNNIRTIWNKDEEKFYISVVDIICVLTDKDYNAGRNYWKVLKFRLKDEGNETVTKCNQLKLKTQDGKNLLAHMI